MIRKNYLAWKTVFTPNLLLALNKSFINFIVYHHLGKIWRRERRWWICSKKYAVVSSCKRWSQNDSVERSLKIQQLGNWWGKEEGGIFVVHVGTNDTRRPFFIWRREKRKVLKEKRVDRYMRLMRKIDFLCSTFHTVKWMGSRLTREDGNMLDTRLRC